VDKRPCLWINECNPQYTHRIDMKIGHFVAWSLSDWANGWTREGNHVSTSCCVNTFSLPPKPNRYWGQPVYLFSGYQW